MRILMTGGGTAGHINPALANANAQLQCTNGQTAQRIPIQDGTYYIPCTAADDFTDLTRMLYAYTHQTKGLIVEYDMRLSLYKGNYSGEYIPPRSILATSVSFTKTDQLDVVLEVDDA